MPKRINLAESALESDRTSLALHAETRTAVVKILGARWGTRVHERWRHWSRCEGNDVRFDDQSLRALLLVTLLALGTLVALMALVTGTAGRSFPRRRSPSEIGQRNTFVALIMGASGTSIIEVFKRRKENNLQKPLSQRDPPTH